MTLKPLLAATLLAFAAGTALADDISVSKEHFVAYKSRAEMRAEVAQARAAGTLQPVGEGDGGAPAAATPRPAQREAQPPATPTK